MDIAFYVCTPMYMRFCVCTHIYKAVHTLRATPLCTVPVTQKEERLTKGLTWKERLASLGEELVVANLLLAWSKKLEDSREPVLLSKPVLPGERAFKPLLSRLGEGQSCSATPPLSQLCRPPPSLAVISSLHSWLLGQLKR